MADDLRASDLALHPLPGQALGPMTATPLGAERIERWARAVGAPGLGAGAAVSSERAVLQPSVHTASHAHQQAHAELGANGVDQGVIYSSLQPQRQAQPMNLAEALPGQPSALTEADRSFMGDDTQAEPLATEPSSPPNTWPTSPPRRSTPDSNAQAEVECSVDAPTARALSLSELRGLHANHRQTKSDADTASARATNAGRQSATADVVASAGLTMPSHGALPGHADALTDASTAAPSGATEQLQSLIESCCDRLWISDGGGNPQGVLLDLGRWMPGCTLEVAKAAGMLRITLRGVDEARRVALAGELDHLGDALAQQLGCRVVAAIEAQKELA